MSKALLGRHRVGERLRAGSHIAGPIQHRTRATGGQGGRHLGRSAPGCRARIVRAAPDVATSCGRVGASLVGVDRSRSGFRRPAPSLRLGGPEDSEHFCSLVSELTGVIQRAPLGNHGCVFDEDLEGEAAGSLAHEHAPQFIAFPIGLDDQRLHRMQRSMAIATVALESESLAGWLAGSSQKTTLSSEGYAGLLSAADRTSSALDLA